MLLMLSYLTPSLWDHIPSVACAAIARFIARNNSPVPQVVPGMKASFEQPTQKNVHCGRAFVCASVRAYMLYVAAVCAAARTCILEELVCCVANTKKGSRFLTTNLVFIWWAIRDSNPEPTD